MLSKGIEFLEHTADVLVKVSGNSLEEVFARAGIALFEVMTNTKNIKPIVKREVSVEGFDLENLLYRWLEELLFIFDTEAIVFGDIEVLEVKREGFKVKAICYGEKFNPKKHEVRTEVKAVTYAQMRIWRENESWYATFVLDI